MNKRIAIVWLTMISFLAGCGWFGKKTANQVNQEVLEGEKVKLQREIDKKYDNPEAHYDLGKIYQNEGLLDRADWEFTLALQFDPVMYKAQAARVKIYQQMGQADRARMAAELYISQASLLGKGFQNEGLDEYALECYQTALSKAPNSSVLNKQIGYYYLAQGDMVRAEEYLRRSIQLDPYQPEVAEQLGRMGVVIQVPKKPGDSKKVDKAMSGQ